MNSKHTPGRWTCFSARAAFTNRCCPIEADGVEIAKVWCDGDQFPEHVGEANARLIAKAPELLECLRQCADKLREVYLADCGPISVCPDVVTGFEAARALIAEIEGGEG